MQQQQQQWQPRPESRINWGADTAASADDAAGVAATRGGDADRGVAPSPWPTLWDTPSSPHSKVGEYRSSHQTRNETLPRGTASGAGKGQPSEGKGGAGGSARNGPLVRPLLWRRRDSRENARAQGETRA